METDEMIGQQDLKYEMTETVKRVEDVGKITVYGVLVYRRGYAASMDKTKCCRLTDISSQKETVERFLRKLSENNVSPINVEECFEDLCSL